MLFNTTFNNKTDRNVVHYIAYYADLNNKYNYHIVPAGVTKMSYVISALKRAGCYVNVFSTAGTRNRFHCHFKRREEQIDAQQKNIHIDSFGSRFKLIRGLDLLWALLQLFYYLVVKVKTGEKVLVYHSCIYKWPILLARKFNKFLLIYEVEEIYNSALGNHDRAQENEISFLKISNGYLLVNELMAEKCGFDDKPYVVSYGSYLTPHLDQRVTDNDGHIHVVYAGGIDKEGSDAFLAVHSAEYYDKNYMLHILGFGREENILLLNNLIERINLSHGRQVVNYEGCLFGNEYNLFLAKCHIGLCTRVLENSLSDFTFPSKLIVYIAHNLIPICSPISCVKKSKIADSVVFYLDNTPQSVAAAVKSVNAVDHRNISANLTKLDADFVLDIRRLFKTLDSEMDMKIADKEI